MSLENEDFFALLDQLSTRVVLLISGYPGRDITKALISRNFTWPGLSQDVRRFLRNYDVCGRLTVWRERRKGLFKPLPIPD